MPFEGGCQCGAVRYGCGAQPFVSYTCHCLACQKLTGSAFATCIQVPEESLSIVKGAPSSRARPANSGNRLTTSFCADCGSALYSENSARPRLRTIYAGTLDCAADVEVNAHIWTKRRLPWVVLPKGHRVFSEAGDWREDYAADPSRLER
ncbi:GFA family protein [Spiribacter halobius]|uniref:GFA family protein n=1 Tax=Sediminicurvatus halobius TaxID=2182432 RepID=UPI0034E26A7D